jgi:hypothetical protein
MNRDSRATVNRLLSDAKVVAFELKEDAAIIESYARSSPGWESLASTVAQVKEHIGQARLQLTKLENARAGAWPWQIVAIDRIRPLFGQLIFDIEAAVERVEDSRARTHTSDYKEYLEANADSAERLAQLVADFVDYTRTKDRLERLTNELELQSQ